MASTTSGSTARFLFIGHALDGEGGFRPSVTGVVRDDGTESITASGRSYLIRYPRESSQKYGRRNEVAFYASPLAQACSRFVGYITTKPATRDPPHDLYKRMSDDIDGRGNSLDVFMQQFMINAKARGSMLLLVDMPAEMSPNLAAQLRDRRVPYWLGIKPERLIDCEVGDDGKFNFAEFREVFTRDNGERVDAVWRFDRTSWQAKDDKGAVLASGEHPLGECPLIIWTEGGDFPCFGPFAAIADLSKRLFNLDSELDEILRSQTFSLLTMQVAEGSTNEQKMIHAQTAGQVISTHNLLVHEGTTPAYVAPSDGPAATYMQRIDAMRAQINELSLNVATINEQESGIAMQMRFQAINAELSKFAARMEDFERRAWELSRRWLGMTQAPTTEWPRDFDIADVSLELQILQDMQAAAMPPEVIHEQQRRVVSVQFAGLPPEKIDEMMAAIDEASHALPAGGNVVPLDRNAPLREAAMRSLGLANGAG